MFNFFKGIFGLSPDDSNHIRFEGKEPSLIKIEKGNNDDSIRPSSQDSMNMFEFPVFNNPIEIHKYFDTLIDEMQKMFESTNAASIIWGNHRGEIYSDSFEESFEKPKTLRDSFLKSGFISDKQTKKEDIDLDGQIKIDDIQNILKSDSNMPNDQISVATYAPSKVYSKSVFIKTVHKPDGTVETIKKIQDHTGKEETIVTHSNVFSDSSSERQQLIPVDDTIGISVFRKFFPF